MSKETPRSSSDAPLMVMCSRASGGTKAGKYRCQALTREPEMSKSTNLTGIARFKLVGGQVVGRESSM